MATTNPLSPQQSFTLIPVQEYPFPAGSSQLPPGDDLEQIDAAQRGDSSFFHSWKWTAVKVGGVMLALAFIHQAGVHTGVYHTSALSCEASTDKQVCIEDLARRSLESITISNKGLFDFINHVSAKTWALGSGIIDASLMTVNALSKVAWLSSLVLEHPIESTLATLFGFYARKPAMELAKRTATPILGKAGTAGSSLLNWTWSIAKGGFKVVTGLLGPLAKKIAKKY